MTTPYHPLPDKYRYYTPKTLPQGHFTLNTLLEAADPRAAVAALSPPDLFWLFHVVGFEDATPLLELATEEQWETLLDLNVWVRDELNVPEVWKWLRHLAEADDIRLAQWLVAKGRPLFSLCLYRSADILMKEEEDGNGEIPPGYETIDGIFCFRVRNPEEQGTIASLLQILAAYDLDEYQSLLANLALIVPAEVEEELYRFRTARTREYGFVSYEEAISVYAPLKMDEVCQKETLRPHVISIYDDSLPVPATPFALLQQEQLLVQACRRAPDAAFRDRMQIEFADLCNLVLAADITEPPVDQEMVARAWLRAGYYLEIALNRWTDRDVAKAEKILRTHSLETIFRVGWGFVMNLRTEARKWQQTSWAHTAGKAPIFGGHPGVPA